MNCHFSPILIWIFVSFLLQTTWSKCTSLSLPSNGGSPLRTTWRPCLHIISGSVDFFFFSSFKFFIFIFIQFGWHMKTIKDTALVLLLCFFHSHWGRLWGSWEHQTCWPKTWSMAWATAWSPTWRSSVNRLEVGLLCLSTFRHISQKIFVSVCIIGLGIYLKNNVIFFLNQQLTVRKIWYQKWWPTQVCMLFILTFIRYRMYLK